MALYGQELSFEEHCLRNYYLALDKLEAALKKDRVVKFSPSWEPSPAPPNFKKLYAALKEEEKIISLIFIDAVNTHNRNVIKRLADAVWFFRDKRHLQTTAYDPQRNQLLYLKTVLEENKQTIELREVAEFLGMGKKVYEDGFSALRRKCKQLGLPLRESRKIRSK